MNKFYTAIVTLLIGLSAITAPSPAEAKPRGSLVDRMSVCVALRGDQGSSLPCVWYSPLQEEVEGNSRIVRRSGRVQPITDERGRRIILAVIDRIAP